jgi:hypothetical protein
MKRTHALTAGLLAGLIGTASADTLHLKNGTTYQGKILSETKDSYLVEVMVTKSIKEERTIARTDVTKIDREKLDETAFVEIAKLAPAPDLLAAEDYRARLELCYKFVKTYPSSPLAAKARAIAGELEKEIDVIAQGGVKLGGKLVTATERQADKVEINARVLESSIRAHAKNSQWVLALRDFVKLEAEYSNTAPFKDVLPFARKVIQQYNAQLIESAAGLPKRLADRKVGLERMSSEDRNASNRAIAEVDEAAAKKAAEEKAAGIKWTTPDDFNKTSLDEAIRYSDQELKRLENLRTDAKVDAGKAWRDAWSAIQGSDAKVVVTALSEARAARLSNDLIAELETLAKKAGHMK